jgi:hypothetical protein
LADCEVAIREKGRPPKGFLWRKLSPAGSLRGVLFEKKNASFSKLARANTSSASFVGTFPSRGRLPKGSLWRELSPAGD